MKHIAYIVLFLFIIIIVIPLIFVKGCKSNYKHNQEPIKQDDGLTNEISLYITGEDKVIGINFDEYLKGVVAAEMPASFHIEALRAQAVAARTYTYYRIQNKKNSNQEVPEHQGAFVCDNPSHCKAWISKDIAFERWGKQDAKKYWDKVSDAVVSTEDFIITYDNEPIDAVFHSTSSGKTENSEDVWISTIPYLRATESVGDEQSPKYTSKIEISTEEFKMKLKEYKPEIQIDKMDNLSIDSAINHIERTEGGSVKMINIGDCNLKGTEIRKIFGLNSSNFSLQIHDDKLVFDVKGNGHGVGMSQYGANYFANEGMTYEEILKHYYKDVDLIHIKD